MNRVCLESRSVRFSKIIGSLKISEQNQIVRHVILIRIKDPPTSFTESLVFTSQGTRERTLAWDIKRRDPGNEVEGPLESHRGNVYLRLSTLVEYNFP